MVHALSKCSRVAPGRWISATSRPSQPNSSTKAIMAVAIATRPKSAGVRTRASTSMLIRPTERSSRRKPIIHALPRTSARPMLAIGLFTIGV